TEKPAPAPAQPVRWRTRTLWLALVALIALAAFVTSWKASSARGVRYKQVTFRRGQVGGARFIPGKREIIYGAQWEDQPRQFFLIGAGGTASRALGFEGQGLTAVSRTGDLALLNGPGTMNITGGLLSRASLDGGPYQTVDQNIFGADWSFDNRL